MRTVAGLEVLRDLDPVDDVVGVVLVRRACCAGQQRSASCEQKQDKDKEDKMEEKEESDIRRWCGCSSQTR